MSFSLALFSNLVIYFLFYRAIATPKHSLYPSVCLFLSPSVCLSVCLALSLSPSLAFILLSFPLWLRSRLFFRFTKFVLFVFIAFSRCLAQVSLSARGYRSRETLIIFPPKLICKSSCVVDLTNCMYVMCMSRRQKQDDCSGLQLEWTSWWQLSRVGEAIASKRGNEDSGEEGGVLYRYVTCIPIVSPGIVVFSGKKHNFSFSRLIVRSFYCRQSSSLLPVNETVIPGFFLDTRYRICFLSFAFLFYFHF